MSKEWMEYVNDSRTVCKYGSKCYQKNPLHHTNYKHPPLKNNGPKRRFEPYPKKISNARFSTDTDSTSKVNAVTSENIEHKQELELNSKECTDDDKTASNSRKSDDNIGSSSNETPEPNQIKSFHEKTMDPTMFKNLFLVEMPEDFFKFMEFLKQAGHTVINALDTVNLELIGPYDLLLGKLPKVNNEEMYLTHWRFFYDPPEFQSVFKKKNSEYHVGYYRDNPNDKPIFLGCNDSAKDCVIKPLASNIFGAVYLHLQHEKKQSPFKAVPCQKLMNEIKKYADENNVSLEEYNLKSRSSKIVAKTFHGAGIVVPYDKKTQLGYRHLVETDANLKKIFTKLQNASSQNEKDKILSELQPVITYASIAVDECDFGTGLEVGIDLFCSGLKELEPSALASLTTAYTLLGRSEFSDIIKAHLKNRRKGPLMSMIN